MKKHNIVTMTLIISGLALNPVWANATGNSITQNKTTTQTISENISSLLFNRGIEKDIADKMASNLVSEKDEMVLSMMIQNLEIQNIVKTQEVLDFLSTAALYKQKINFHSYDHVLGMVSKIKQKSLDKKTRMKLSKIVKINQQLFV